MRIKFIRTVSGSRQCFVAGEEHDLDTVEAQSAVTHGLAVPVAQEPPAVEPKPEATLDAEKPAEATQKPKKSTRTRKTK
jgi:hypothetical protein